MKIFGFAKNLSITAAAFAALAFAAPATAEDLVQRVTAFAAGELARLARRGRADQRGELESRLQEVDAAVELDALDRAAFIFVIFLIMLSVC